MGRVCRDQLQGLVRYLQASERELRKRPDEQTCADAVTVAREHVEQAIAALELPILDVDTP